MILTPDIIRRWLISKTEHEPQMRRTLLAGQYLIDSLDPMLLSPESFDAVEKYDRARLGLPEVQTGAGPFPMHKP